MKTVLYTLIAAAVIIGVWLLVDKQPSQPDTALLEISGEGKLAGKYSLKEIIALDESFKCEFERSDGDSEVKGTLNIAPGSKVRGDFEIESEAVPEPFQSHFIMRGGNVYTWTSLLNVGFIAPVTEDDIDGQAGSVSLTEELDYSCERAMIDQALFQIPADITFTSAPQ